MSDFSENAIAKIQVNFGVDSSIVDQATLKEVILNESLLTPGLQTFVKVHSYFHNVPVKNLDQLKNKTVTITAEKEILQAYGFPTTFNAAQKIYRLADRKLVNDNTEEFTVHACDQTLLNDAKSLVSKMWKCTTPSAVTSEVLSTCAGAYFLDVESAQPARDYMAENIHPFQVVAQQANAALAGGDDPSFLHYMTFEGGGTHHFRSLKTLTAQAPVCDFYYDNVGNASGTGYANPHGILTHSFPCDFDLLSDLLNGLDESGKDINTLITFNPLMRMSNQFGSKANGCGLGNGNPKVAMSAAGSEQQQNMCPDYSQYYVLRRQARMALLEQDKIALRLVVPWNPVLHAGKVIELKLHNKNDKSLLNYGSGTYLISSLTHNLKYGGFSTTTMDCVSTTVGSGVV